MEETVTSRRTLRENPAQPKGINSKVVVAVAVALALVASLVAYLFLQSDNRSITSIEEHIPEEASAVFISEANEKAWKYMTAISGQTLDYPSDAQYLGVALVGATPIIYIEGETEDIKKNFETQNIEYLSKENVHVISTDEAHIVDNGLGTTDEYRDLSTSGNNTSFGYVDFDKASSGHPKSLTYSFPNLGKWTGTFKNSRWEGVVTDVDYSSLDPVKQEDEIISSPSFRSFADNYEYKFDGDSFVGSFRIQDLNNLSEVKYNTSMSTVEFEINGSNMNFKIGLQ